MEKTCFVVAAIGEPDSPERYRADQVLKYIIEPAARGCNFSALRADRSPEPGMIMSEVIQHLVEDPIVVADLTGRNPNVYFEFGIRHAFQKPIVQIIDHQERIPFDLAPVRTIHVDHRDLTRADEARMQIAEQIRAALGSGVAHSPVNTAGAVLALRQGTGVEVRLAQLLEMVQSISSRNYDRGPFIYPV